MPVTSISDIMDGVVFADAEARVTLVNPVAEDLLSLQRTLILGRTIDEIIQSSPSAAALLDDATTAGDGEDERQRTIEVHYGDKDLRYIRATTSPVMDHEGSLAGTMIVLRNVTSEHKEDQLKNQYLSIVAHELRTPLTGIKTFSTLMAHGSLGELTDQQQEVIDSIREQSLRLEHQIDKLVNLGFIDAKEYEQDVEILDVQELVNGAVSPFDQLAKDREMDLEVDFQFDDESAVRVAADRADLKRSLKAIIENALKFTPDGGAVRVSASATEDGKKVLFSVRDEGIGIDPRYHERIFEKFFQVEDPLTRHHGGAGLGLFVSQGILEAHGTGIRVKSELGHGAEFTFELPIYDEEGEDVVLAGETSSEVAQG